MHTTGCFIIKLNIKVVITSAGSIPDQALRCIRCNNRKLEIIDPRMRAGQINNVDIRDDHVDWAIKNGCYY